MPKLRVALPRDFLTPQGTIGANDIGLKYLDRASRIVEYHWMATDTKVVTPEQIANADAVMLLAGYMNRDTFANGAENLTVIARFGIGYDKVDMQALTENDVALFITTDADPIPLASAALTFMLVLAKRLMPNHMRVKERRWDKLIDYEFLGDEIQNHTLGVIGLGRSAVELIRLVEPFGMRVLAFTRTPEAKVEYARNHNVELVTLDELLTQSDYVSIHCPLTPETRSLIGAREFGLMKPTAYLINVSRGGIIDHVAMVEALRQHRIAGAGLDTHHLEPLPLDDPLLDLDNVVLAPHIIASTQEIWAENGRVSTTGLIQVAQGKIPRNIINREVLARPGFQAKLARFAVNEGTLE